MKYIVQENLKGKVFLRGGEEETIELIREMIERKIPINITYIEEIDITPKN